MNNKFKLSKVSIITVILIGLVAIPTISSAAYSKSYSFNISHSVSGSTNHSLAKKRTTTLVNGNTYFSSGNVKPSKSGYKVFLSRTWKSYNISAPADGKTHSRSFGSVDAGNYKVRVDKTSAGAYGDRVKGSGTINQ